MGKLIRFMFMAVFLSFSIYGCGGSGTSSSTSSTSSTSTTTTTKTIAGAVVKGPVSGATVEIWGTEGGEAVLLDNVTTDKTGKFTANIDSDYNGPVAVKAYGGTYYNEAEAVKKIANLKAYSLNIPLHSIVASLSNTIAVTPVTEIVYRNVVKSLGVKSNVSQIINKVAEEKAKVGEVLDNATKAFGLNVTTTIPAIDNETAKNKDSVKAFAYCYAVSKKMANTENGDLSGALDSIDMGNPKLSAVELINNIDNATEIQDALNTIGVNNENSLSNTLSEMKSNLSGDLKLNLGFEGVYVSVLNDSMSGILLTKQTDSSGFVAFSKEELGNKSNVNLSIVLSPDVVMDKDMIFYSILENKYEYDCEEVDDFEMDILKNEKIPLAEGDGEPVEIPDLSDNLTPLDSNKDGYLDKNEIYDAVIKKFDNNSDGKIEVREFFEKDIDNKGAFFVGVLRSVPTGIDVDVDISSLIKKVDWFGYFMSDIDILDILYSKNKYKNLKESVVVINNVPENAYDFYIDNDDNLNPNVAAYNCQEQEYDNDSYSGRWICKVLTRADNNDKVNFFIYYYRDTGRAYRAVTFTGDNVSIDYDSFTDGVPIDINYDNVSENIYVQDISLWQDYNGILYNLFNGSPSKRAESNAVIKGFDTDYLLGMFTKEDTVSKRDLSGNTFFKGLYFYSIGKELPDAIDVAKYTSLLDNVSVSIEESETSSLNYFNIYGSDKNKMQYIVGVVDSEFDDGDVNMFYLSPYRGESEVYIPSCKNVIPQTVLDRYQLNGFDGAESLEFAICDYGQKYSQLNFLMGEKQYFDTSYGIRCSFAFFNAE